VLVSSKDTGKLLLLHGHPSAPRVGWSGGTAARRRVWRTCAWSSTAALRCAWADYVWADTRPRAARLHCEHQRFIRRACPGDGPHCDR